MNSSITKPEYEAWIRLAPRNCAPSKAVQMAAFELLRVAEQAGQVVTIEQVPLQPLAMGHYETVVHVRPARGKA